MPALSCAKPLLIISDLHYGHPTGTIKTLAELGPLLEGIKTLVINGDFTESRLGADLARAQRQVDEMRQFAAASGIELVMLNGNHDPGLYEQDWLELADGQVIVTHGDCLYWDIAPWSPEIEPYQKKWQPHRAEWEAACQDGWPRLLAYTAARRKEVRHGGEKLARGPGGKWRSALRLAVRPRRVLRMVWVWATSHHRAGRLLRRFSPQARFFIYGHTHRSLVTRLGPLCIINTGAWQAYATTRIVRLGGGELRIGKVKREGEGLAVVWEPPMTLGTFDEREIKVR